ncbi:60S ribosomal protein L7 [Apophysomyces sp. BC1034]|nr:60S ribosomal protein L7 [Apophysomyces sp. BC1015]KAG0179069.1 60S ribosomal protein L7 [Apophysomyces sp. BC1021]KAG0189342.1 60S ribosomal protein L7 [Apophysomyces sp. BC1034]
MPENQTVADPTYVPEILLKKRKINERAAIENARKRAELRKSKKKSLKTAFKRADEFVRKHRKIQKEDTRIRRQSRKPLNVPEQPKLLFVLRNNGERDLHPAVKRTFKKMRLVKLHQGVFVKLDKQSAEQLKLIEPYVTYGEPTLKTVQDLVIKRGYAKIKGKRVAISDNTMVEEALGKHNIICIEDIIHELVSLGENFTVVNQFLWPFRLNDPVKGWRMKKMENYTEKGKEAESVEDDINKMIEAMN